MSNLRFTDRELQEMEKYHNPSADRELYHLTYIKKHKDNEILNPHLPGRRPEAADQEKGETDEQNITNPI